MSMKLTAGVLFVVFFSFSLYADEGPRIVLQYPTGGRITATAFDSSRHVLYAVSEDRYLYALSGSGKRLWRYAVGGPAIASLTVGTDHTVYTGTAEGVFIAVNPYGREIWHIQLDSTVFGNAVSSAEGTLFVVTRSGSLYCISHRGFIRYRLTLPARPALAPLLNNHYLFIPCANNRLYTFDDWGTLKWIFLFSGKIMSAVCTDTAFYGGTSSGTVAAVGMNGEKIWSTAVHTSVSSLVLSSSGMLYCSAGKNMIALDSEGAKRWISTGKNALDSSGVLGEWVVTADAGGTLSFRLFDGTLAGSVLLGKPSVPLIHSQKGEIVLGSKNWNLYFAGYPDIVIAQSNSVWPLENGRSEGNRSVESPVLKGRSLTALRNSSNDFEYLKTLVVSGRRDALSRVLDSIDRRIMGEKYDRGKSFFLPMLEYLASDCITRPYYRNNILVNNFPAIRSRADALLGTAGNFRTQEFLLSLLRYEWNRSTLESIIRSIGLLGYNPEDKTIDALDLCYKMQRRNNNSEQYRMVLLQSIGSIYQYNGTLSRKGIALVLDIFNDSMSRITRLRALTLLHDMKK